MSDQIQTQESQILDAVKVYHTLEKPNIAKLAREFEVPYQRLRARIHGRENKTASASLKKALNPIQEKALRTWINTLHIGNMAIPPSLIQKTANLILQQGGSDQTVGPNWVYRYIQRLPPHIPYFKPKMAEKVRLDSENYGPLLLWFNNLRTLFEKHNFLPHEIFNWDETGYQIGQGKRQKVVAPSVNYTNPTGGQKESITGIECISASGWVMLPWFLPKGTAHMEEWFTKIKIPDFRIKPTPNGYIDNETAYEWLCSFHEATIPLVKKGRPRLLLMDNHGSHTTLEFTSFCKENFIIPFFFLPHTTHLCQPLDGKAFQCLKHYFRTANNEAIMWGGSASKKRDFFRLIHDIRVQTFTQRTIRSSFESRGIYPLNPEVILAPLRQKTLDLEAEEGVLQMFNTPSPPPEFASSITNSPPDNIERVNKLNTKLLDDMKQLDAHSQRLKRHVKRSMDANTLLAQENALLQAELRKARVAQANANEPRNRRSILGSNHSVLSPICANRKIAKRQDSDFKKQQRIQAKHAKQLEAEAQAQKARDLADAEYEAAMAAKDSRGANWYIDSYGGYL